MIARLTGYAKTVALPWVRVGRADDDVLRHGALVKTAPAIVLMLVALAILDDR
jgi:hypothetical protein